MSADRAVNATPTRVRSRWDRFPWNALAAAALVAPAALVAWGVSWLAGEVGSRRWELVFALALGLEVAVWSFVVARRAGERPRPLRALGATAAVVLVLLELAERAKGGA